MSAPDAEFVGHGRFQAIAVPPDLAPKTTTKSFIQHQGLDYLDGAVFYELTKPETITAAKHLVAQNRATGDLITGTAVRVALGFSARTRYCRLDPDLQTEFRAFVQSTSPTRHLVPNTTLLYETTTGKHAPPSARTRSAASAPAELPDEENEDSIATRRTSERLRALKSTDHVATPPTAIRPSKRRKTSPTPATTAKSPTPKLTALKSRKQGSLASAPVSVVSGPAATDSAVPESQLVFSFDTTGSMASCLQKVKNDVQTTVTRLLASVPGLSIAIIAHGDYCDADIAYVLKLQDFTRDAATLCEFVRGCTPTWGGDFDECYELALHEARTRLSWREEAANKSVVLIGDATPHEPDYEQNVKGIDWRRECELMRADAIKVYAVRCLAWMDSAPFYKEVARRTSGHYLELHQLYAIADFLVAISLSAGAGGKDALLSQFRQEVRSRGGLTRNMRDLFRTLREREEGATGEEDDEDEIEDEDLQAVAAGRFQLLEVPHRIAIQEFVTASCAVFEAGKAFYEFTKPEIISDRKEIVLLDKRSGDMFTGPCAREKAGIAPGDGTKRRVKPPASDRWVLFVQSTSYNRMLVGGTRFLYEAT